MSLSFICCARLSSHNRLTQFVDEPVLNSRPSFSRPWMLPVVPNTLTYKHRDFLYFAGVCSVSRNTEQEFPVSWIHCWNALFPEYISGVCSIHCRCSLFAEHTTGALRLLNTLQEFHVFWIQRRSSLFAEDTAGVPCFLNALQESPVGRIHCRSSVCWICCSSALFPDCTAGGPSLLNTSRNVPIPEYTAGVSRIKKGLVY
jgi:hypothetical protein